MCHTKTKPLYGIKKGVDYHTSTDIFIGVIHQSQNQREWQITLLLKNQWMKFKIDIGAQSNVISKQKFFQVFKVPLQKFTANLVAFGGHRLTTCGKALIPCQHNSKKYDIEFKVLEQDVLNILGLPKSVELNLVKCVNTVDKQNTLDNNDTEIYEQYKDVFNGLGCITDILYHINTDPSCQPVIHPPCHVPIKLWSKIKEEEVKRMEILDVIEKVNTPTSWVNSMVMIVKPNGTLHICIDPRDFNKAIRHEYYPMQTIEEVVTNMPNATIFQS